MQNLLGDLRYTVRQFRMSPVFTAAAVMMVIGAIASMLQGAKYVHDDATDQAVAGDVVGEPVVR